MVAHLELRIHDLQNEEIGNIIAYILWALEKTELYEANHSLRIYTF